MKKFLSSLFVCFLVCFSSHSFAQEKHKVILDNVFKDASEIYFTTTIGERNEINLLTKIISIDNVKGLTIYAYANRKEFDKFLDLGYNYTILPHPGTLLRTEDLNMRDVNSKSPLTTWNFYPTYDEYISEMNGFAAAYPSICKVVPIGTTTEGRQLLAVKISDSLDVDQGVPQVLLTSTIHGDEVTGYVLMLHLIDSLLTGYGQNTRITNLVNNYQIFINPLANPDGTYHGGNSTVYGAQRENGNNIDINRNFPDPTGNQHPDGNAWQAETMAFMQFDSINHFVMSMNFHGGDEVFNYPWDTWSKLHADDAWFNFVGREYADTAHKYGPAGYFMGPSGTGNGVTNGYAWYTVEGGRQDYTTYFHNGREVTLEISAVKTPSPSQLPGFWNDNFRSFMDYIEESGYGINGRVTDSVTNKPVLAKVLALAHDKDNSFVYSKLPSGWYFRPISQGTYNLSFSAAGYFTRTILGVPAATRTTTRLNVKLIPLSIGYVNEIEHLQTLVYPNPSGGDINLLLPAGQPQHYSAEVFNTLGKLVSSFQFDHNGGSQPVSLDMTNLANGLYLLKLSGENKTYESRLVIRK